MKARAEGITLTLSKEEGIELRNQIIWATNGSIDANPEYKGTALANLFELLSGNFENSSAGVNFPKETP